MDSQIRSKRLKPEVNTALAEYRAKLLLGVRNREITADFASTKYHKALARVVRDPACHVHDDRSWTAVKCRACGHTSSVPTDVDYYSCPCSPSTKQHAINVMVGMDGKHLVDPDWLPVGLV